MTARLTLLPLAALLALAFLSCTERTEGTCEDDTECPAGLRCKLDWPNKHRCVTPDGSLPDGGAGDGPQGDAWGRDAAWDASYDSSPPDMGGTCSVTAHCTTATFPVCDPGSNRCVACLENAQCMGATPFCVNKRCVACTEDTHCAAADKPICDKAANACIACTADAQCKAKSPAAPVCAPGGRCAQCKTNAECSGATPACSPTTNTCVACVDDAQCTTAAQPICDNSKNECIGCAMDSQCKAKSAAAPACLMDGRCVQCKANTDCSGATPVCNVAMNKCVACTEDSHCGAADKPICNKTTNECVPCMADAQCETKNAATKGCAAGRCVACTKSDHCSVATTPICGAGNACVACTADAQCAMKGNLGPNPGVCMSHQDGRCATDAETIYVSRTPTCASGNGSAGAPLCSPQAAITAVQANRSVIVVKGPTPVEGMAWSNATPSLSLVGQGNATIAGGANPALTLQTGTLYARDIVFSSGAATVVGVLATSGSTLRLERVKVEDNRGGGVQIDGAAFEFKNVRISRNGPGRFMSIAPWSGMIVNNPRSGGPSRLERVSLVDNDQGGPSLLCGAAIQGSGLFATGMASTQVDPMCGFAACTPASATCGSDLPP